MVEVVRPAAKLTCDCYKCGAGLSYTQLEVKNKTVSDYTGDRDTVHFIVCPVCSADVSVSGYLPRR